MTTGEKHQGRYAAYYRVSTDKQGKSKLGLEAQQATVKRYLDGGRHHLKEFEEVESGKKADRPKLEEALRYCRLHHAALIVAKLDRLTRNVDFLRTVEKGCDPELGVIFCDLPKMPEGPLSRFMVTIMAAVAELEAGLISDRTKAALAAAKARGVTLGGNPENLTLPDRKGVRRSIAVRQEKARQRNKDLAAIVVPMRRGRATLQAIADALNTQDPRIEAPRGGQWYPASVRLILPEELRRLPKLPKPAKKKR